jgi:uncharacterized membrane protein (UPF0127 family)
MSATLMSALLLAVVAFSACSSSPQSILASPLPLATATASAIDYPQPSFVASPDCENLVFGILPLTELTISSAAASDITLHVEVADDASERSQGLMCREPIPPGTGMLFTYDTDRSNGFWMFNTYTPIDILYLDQSGHVVDTITMSPCPRGPGEGSGSDFDRWQTRCADEAGVYVPSGPWRNTLELPAGWLDVQGLGGLPGRDFTITWATPQP